MLNLGSALKLCPPTDINLSTNYSTEQQLAWKHCHAMLQTDVESAQVGRLAQKEFEVCFS